MTTQKPKPEDMAVIAKTLGLAAGEAQRTIPSLTVCGYPDGAAVIREGETGSDTFVVLKGEVSVRSTRWLFFQKEVARLKSGDIFGEIGFLVSTARSASVVAAGPCEVFRLAAKEFRDHLERHPDLRTRIEEMARQRLYSLSAGA